MATEDRVVRAWANVHFAYREMSRLVDERLRTEADCSLSDMDVLNELNCHPERRMQMLDLADRLGVTRGGLTRMIDRLVERGWVDRDRPAHNRREVYAVVTEDGVRVAGRARAVYVEALMRTLGHLDEAALDGIATGMGRLRDTLAATTGRPTHVVPRSPVASPPPR